MSIASLRLEAHRLGIDQPRSYTRPVLIRAIQQRLGEPVCFGGDERYDCPRTSCRWRGDCQRPIAEWLR